MGHDPKLEAGIIQRLDAELGPENSGITKRYLDSHGRPVLPGKTLARVAGIEYTDRDGDVVVTNLDHKILGITDHDRNGRHYDLLKLPDNLDMQPTRIDRENLDYFMQKNTEIELALNIDHATVDTYASGPGGLPINMRVDYDSKPKGPAR